MAPILESVETLDSKSVGCGAPPLLPWINGEPGSGDGIRVAVLGPSTGEPIAWVACVALQRGYETR